MAKKARYLRNKITGVIWPYTPMMMGIPNKAGVVLQRQIGNQLVPGHPDMVEISEEEAMAILNKAKAPAEVVAAIPENEEPEMSAEERIPRIEDAIASLPEDGFGKGAVPYPKVNDVSAITGFPVSFQEIKTIFTTMRGSNDSSGTGKKGQESIT